VSNSDRSCIQLFDFKIAVLITLWQDGQFCYVLKYDMHDSHGFRKLKHPGTNRIASSTIVALRK